MTARPQRLAHHRVAPIFGALLTALVMVLLLPRVGAAQSPDEQTLDRIVAVVNDRVVLQSDLERELATARASIRQRDIQAPPEARLREQVLNQLILQRLQLGAAEKAGISVDEATIDDAVRRVARRNEMDLRELRDALKQEGISMSRYRERLRRDIKISRVRQQALRQRVQVTSQEVDQLLARDSQQRREYRIGHILFSIPNGASQAQIDDARQRAVATRQALTDGESFERLATTRSDGRSALKGGDVGWRRRGEMPSVLAERLDSLQVGDVSRVLRDAAGFHIFRIAEVRNSQRRVITETHARHILIETNEVTSDQVAREELSNLRQRIVSGESFGDLARANSDDSASASKGGDLGWRRPGEMAPAFQRELDSLEPGEISKPFRSAYGWHIAEVLKRRKRDTTAEYRRRQATNALRKRKRDEELETWLRQLREEAYIDYRLAG